MDGIKSILTKSSNHVNKNIHSEVHYWADVISSYFGERKKFGMYLGLIKRAGVERARQVFAEIKQSSAENPAKLFFWKLSKKSQDQKYEPKNNN